MKDRLFYFSVLILISLNSFASARSKKDGADADPGKPAEASSHFTLPIGFPVSFSSHDSAVENTKGDTSKNVIKGQALSRKKIYQVNINDDNSASGWRQTEEAFRQAQDMNADYILIHVDDDNAYSTASKIRSQLYHYKTPVLLYVENKSKTTNSIIPLNNDTLNQLRNKAQYLSSRFPNSPFDHSANKKNYLASEKKNSTVYFERKYAKNTDEYINSLYGSSVSSSSSVTRSLSEAGINNVDIINYHPAPIGKLIDNLAKPFSSFILMLLILCGIYFEFRSIGKGSALFVSVCASLLLFAAHYFEGMQHGWFILLFYSGVVLLCRDVYYSTRTLYSAISGISLMFSGLVLCLSGSEGILLAVLFVTGTVILSLILCLRLERYLFNLKLISGKAEPDLRISINYKTETLTTTT